MDAWWGEFGIYGMLAGLAATILVTIVYIYFKNKNKKKTVVQADIREAIGKPAHVYLTIPDHKNGMGKVFINIRGKRYEWDAMTEAETLPSGSIVKVAAVIHSRILLVEKQ